MSDLRSRSSQVEVSIDPDAAFAVFTDELDLWWVRGPINNYGAGKFAEMRCESGVGGRLMEVYEPATGEGLELARITTWEPGVRLAWKSSLDDVSIEVRFEPSQNGTVVRLQATIPEGGTDSGGTAMIRVAPRWFGDWLAKRDVTPQAMHDLARFAMTLYYRRPTVAARWLADAFAFEAPLDIPDEAVDDQGRQPWIEFHVGNCSVMIEELVKGAIDTGHVTYMPWVFVDDLTAHLARAEASGATIVEPISTHGFTSYVALDVEGRAWRFAEARSTQPR